MLRGVNVPSDVAKAKARVEKCIFTKSFKQEVPVLGNHKH